jgi:hypothetical protein
MALPFRAKAPAGVSEKHCSPDDPCRRDEGIRRFAVFFFCPVAKLNFAGPRIFRGQP